MQKRYLIAFGDVLRVDPSVDESDTAEIHRQIGRQVHRVTSALDKLELVGPFDDDCDSTDFAYGLGSTRAWIAVELFDPDVFVARERRAGRSLPDED